MSVVTIRIETQHTAGTSGNGCGYEAGWSTVGHGGHKRPMRIAAKAERVAVKEERRAGRETRKADRSERRYERQQQRTVTIHQNNSNKRTFAHPARPVTSTTTPLTTAARDEKDARRREREAKQEIRKQRKLALAEMQESMCESIPEDVDLLLVDGNNLSGGGPRRISCEKLLRLIEDYMMALSRMRQRIKKVVLVFDHYHAPMISELSYVTVEFSGDRIADDVIVERYQDHIRDANSSEDSSSDSESGDELKKEERTETETASATETATATETENQNKKKRKTTPRIMVVTSDRELSIRVLKQGGLVMRSGCFARLVDPQGLYARGGAVRGRSGSAALPTTKPELAPTTTTTTTKTQPASTEGPSIGYRRTPTTSSQLYQHRDWDRQYPNKA
eukprot:TRINITY_DN1138_c0_g1_i4.p1 TRINITY_DN1138_c0_g1~~TRINITY_DN1138_c0_g1_i4.p1  ORF type:complete len:393 (+),score=68.37 TRINITY_DN1138_c0_g1_i4:188-1366(+)